MFFKTDKSLKYFIFLLSFLGSALYFREYIIAISQGFSNYLVSCGDFGQYSYEAYTFFKQEYLMPFLVPAKEPGYFLMSMIFGEILSVSHQSAMFFIDFCTHFLSLFLIGLISLKLTKRRIYGIIALLIAITIYQFSYVYLQLISRQLFSTFFLLLASYIYLSPPKTGLIFLVSLALAMSFMSHRFGGMIYIGAILLGSSFHVARYHRFNYLWLRLLVFSLLLAGPFVYFLSFYFVSYSRLKHDPFLDELSAESNNFIGGFSYLASSGSIDTIPIYHYFTYQNFYIIFIISSFFLLSKNLLSKNLLFVNIFLALVIFTLLKVTFSIRALVSFEIFLIPIIALSFYLIKGKIFKIFTLFSFIFLGVLGVENRIPILATKILPKDSSISFIENNFKPNSTLFLSPIRCESEMLTQLFYSTSMNLGNDSLDGLSNPEQKETLDYVLAQVVAEKNYYNLIEGKPYLHEIFRGKEVYIFFGYRTNQATVNLLKNRTHSIYSNPFLSLIYENPHSKFVKYIFKLDTSQMTYFDNGYYLRSTTKTQLR